MVIALGIRKQKMYIPYRRSRGGTIINKIRTMIRSNETHFNNRETGTWDSFRSKGPDYGNLKYVEKQVQQVSNSTQKRLISCSPMFNPPNQKNYNSTK